MRGSAILRERVEVKDIRAVNSEVHRSSEKENRKDRYIGQNARFADPQE